MEAFTNIRADLGLMPHEETPIVPFDAGAGVDSKRETGLDQELHHLTVSLPHLPSALHAIVIPHMPFNREINTRALVGGTLRIACGKVTEEEDFGTQIKKITRQAVRIVFKAPTVSVEQIYHCGRLVNGEMEGTENALIKRRVTPQGHDEPLTPQVIAALLPLPKMARHQIYKDHLPEELYTRLLAGRALNRTLINDSGTLSLTVQLDTENPHPGVIIRYSAVKIANGTDIGQMIARAYYRDKEFIAGRSRSVLSIEVVNDFLSGKTTFKENQCADLIEKLEQYEGSGAWEKATKDKDTIYFESIDLEDEAALQSEAAAGAGAGASVD